ncbi:hypothetical protein [Terriglobus sp. ADX1]
MGGNNRRQVPSEGELVFTPYITRYGKRIYHPNYRNGGVFVFPAREKKNG